MPCQAPLGGWQTREFSDKPLDHWRNVLSPYYSLMRLTGLSGSVSPSRPVFYHLVGPRWTADSRRYDPAGKASDG
jgi:hypothetical protein